MESTGANGAAPGAASAAAVTLPALQQLVGDVPAPVLLSAPPAQSAVPSQSTPAPTRTRDSDYQQSLGALLNSKVKKVRAYLALGGRLAL
jgi:hypothetical protein